MQLEVDNKLIRRRSKETYIYLRYVDLPDLISVVRLAAWESRMMYIHRLLPCYRQGKYSGASRYLNPSEVFRLRPGSIETRHSGLKLYINASPQARVPSSRKTRLISDRNEQLENFQVWKWELDGILMDTSCQRPLYRLEWSRICLLCNSSSSSSTYKKCCRVQCSLPSGAVGW
jgi:hypothetical protein